MPTGAATNTPAAVPTAPGLTRQFAVPLALVFGFVAFAVLLIAARRRDGN
jgi:hypothetical protein